MINVADERPLLGAKRTVTNRCLPNSMFYKAIIDDKTKLDLKPANFRRRRAERPRKVPRD